MINTTLVKINDILLFLPPHSVPYKILVNFWYNRWEFTKTEHHMEISSLSVPMGISSITALADGNVQRHCSQRRWKFPASLHTKLMEISSVTAQARWKFSASYTANEQKAKIILLFIFVMWASGNLVLETTGSWISSWKPGLERFEDRWAFFKSNAWSGNYNPGQNYVGQDCRMHCLDHRSVFHMETNVLWAKSYLPPSPYAMLFVRKGLPMSRPTLHRGEGGSERILQQFGKKAICPTHFGQDCRLVWCAQFACAVPLWMLKTTLATTIENIKIVYTGATVGSGNWNFRPAFPSTTSPSRAHCSLRRIRTKHRHSPTT